MFSLFLTLALAVLRVYTDHAHHAAPMNDFALHADFLYRGPDFHLPFHFASDVLLFIPVHNPAAREVVR